jgi:hypothetical protein
MILNNLKKKKNKTLFLNESYIMAENIVKRIHLIEGFFKLLIKKLI